MQKMFLLKVDLKAIPNKYNIRKRKIASTFSKSSYNEIIESSLYSLKSLVAQQTCLSEWTELVKDCQNCPQGMKIDE